jgi:hypothetical protein
MIDILSVIVFGGGPSGIAFLIAYWSLKGGRKNQLRVDKKEILSTADYSK